MPAASPRRGAYRVEDRLPESNRERGKPIRTVGAPIDVDSDEARPPRGQPDVHVRPAPPESLDDRRVVRRYEPAVDFSRMFPGALAATPCALAGAKVAAEHRVYGHHPEPVPDIAQGGLAQLRERQLEGKVRWWHPRSVKARSTTCRGEAPRRNGRGDGQRSEGLLVSLTQTPPRRRPS